MRRLRYLSIFLAIVAFGEPLPQETALPISLADWLKTGDQGTIRWSLHVSPPRLDESQRLQTYVRAELGANEFARRPGRWMFFLEIRDRDNRTYRTHGSRISARTNSSQVSWIQPVCIVPGEYELTAALYDSGSKEHNLKQTRLRVPHLHHDPLSGAWSDVPNVEFSGCASRPLSVPLETEKPVHIEVVVNESANRNRMGSLISRLEVISDLAIRNGSMKVTLLDLERQKLSFTQDLPGRLDRRRLRAALRENDPLRIDAQSLANYKGDVQFFVSEIRRRWEKKDVSEAQRVLIILTAPRTFPKEEDLQPIQATPQAGSRVYYIRCRSLAYAFQLPSVGYALGRPRRLRSDPNADSLEQTLKPLNPRLFDVTTPVQFRKALATIISEISQN